MRIAYLIELSADQQGVSRKVREQIQVWQELKQEVVVCTRQRGAAGDSVEGCKMVQYGRFRERLYRPYMLVEAMDSIQPDIVYMRFDTAEPGYSRMLSNYRGVAEVNTHDLNEIRLTRSRVFFWFHLLTRRRSWSKLQGFVFVTHELASALPCYGVASTVIANGIDLRKYSELPPACTKRPALFFVGTPGFVWHGLESILLLARATPGWDYHIVGYSSLPQRPENVRCHGRMEKADYLPILSRCDAALGSFALYAKGMNEACTLKMREYLACGVPVILGHTDTDFMLGADFLLRVPNEKEGLVRCKDEVERFLYRWKGKRVERNLINHISVTLKEQKRLSFFARLTANNSGLPQVSSIPGLASPAHHNDG